MPIVPVYGHAALRGRLLAIVERETLPASLLLQGPRGVGKQRLALWLAQTLLCQAPLAARPCGACAACRYTGELTHPDLYWFFPRPRLKDGDASPTDVRVDYAEAIAERVQRHGLYGPAAGNEALYVATVRAIVQQAAVSPAMGRRKVFVIGDAERMVPQEGADAAANAFLKLLEEPPADTTIILTSSEPGALLPTIKSRVVCVRVGPVADEDVRAFVDDPAVAAVLDAEKLPAGTDARAGLAGGSPGALLAGGEHAAARAEARRLLESVLRGGRAALYRAAFAQGASKARGAYSDVLDALTVELHAAAREASAPLVPGSAAVRDEARARGASVAIDAVETAKARAAGNVNPQLVTAALLRALSGSLR